MNADISIIGDDPLAEGQYISLRYRLDFRVVDADRVLAAARSAYRRLYPEATEEDSVAMVTCAADALYALLEAAGAIADHGEAVAAQSGGGLEPLGGRSQLVIDEPDPLPADRDCSRYGDVFALPPNQAE